MKKFFCLTLIALMTLSLFALPVYAAELPAIAEGDAIYAGEQSITIRLKNAQTVTSLTDEQKALIKITKLSDNSNVEFTSVVTGDILTLIPAESFVINELGATDKTAYSLKLGDVTKVFTVDELYKPSFAIETNSVKSLDVTVGTDATFDVIDANTIVFAGTSSTIVLDYPGIVNYNNASFIADIYYFGDATKRVSAAIGFNITDKNKNTLFNGNKRGAVGRAGWIFQRSSTDTNIKDHARMVAIPDTSATSTNTVVKQFYGYGSGNSIAVLNPIGSAFERAYTASSNFSTAITASTLVVGAETVALPEGFDTTKKYHYAIDKMSEVGTLMINGGLVDVLDTKDYFEQYNKDNSASEAAPTTGYFLFTPYVQNSKIVMQNPRLITSTVIEYEEGIFDVTDIYATKDAMTVTFDRDIKGSDLNHVTITDKHSDVVECSKEINGNKLTIKPTGGFALDENYSISITDKFGYSSVLISDAYNKSFCVKTIKKITFDDGETALDNDILITNLTSGDKAKSTIRNGKLYVEDANYTTIFVRNAVTKLENYHMSFDIQRYITAKKNNVVNLMFNVGDRGTILNYGGNFWALGWRIDGYKNTIYRDFRHQKQKKSDDTTKTAVKEINYNANLTDVVFTATSVENDYDITLPEADATTYNIQLDKKGTKGTLSIDGEYIDTYETKNVYKDWNASQTDDSKILEKETVNSTGDVLITGYCESGASRGTIAIGTITFTDFELISEKVEIADDTYFDVNGKALEDITGVTAVSGTVTVRNYFNEAKPVNVFVGAYSDEVMIDFKVLDTEKTIEPQGIVTGDYSFANLSGLTNIKVFTFESIANIKPQSEAFSFLKNNNISSSNEKVYLFVGDSITAGDTYPALVESYFITRFPGEYATFENAGHSGGTAEDGVRRYYYDIGNRNATNAIILFGMNDIYKDKWPIGADEEGYEEQFNANLGYIDTCLENIGYLVKKLQQQNASVALMTPTVYDSRDFSDAKNNKGCNGALNEVATREKVLAPQIGADLIDLRSSMLDAYNRYLTSGEEEMVRPDRIHPNKNGGYVIAYNVINYLFKDSGLVASVDINALTSSIKTEKAVVENLKVENGEISYTYTAKSLPWYNGENYQWVDSRAYVKLTEDLNREIIKVTGLDASTAYSVKFDGVEVTTATGKELANGINIAILENNPGQKASKIVDELVMQKSVHINNVRILYNNYIDNNSENLDHDLITQHYATSKTLIEQAREAAKPGTYVVTITKN